MKFRSNISLPKPLSRRIDRAVRLTWIGMLAERTLEAFWTFFSFGAALIAVFLLGGIGLFSGGVVQVLTWGLGLGALIALIYGAKVYKHPRPSEALAKVDADLPNQPLQALSDTPVASQNSTRPDDGYGDASGSLWMEHKRRMVAALVDVRAVSSRLNLRKQDPFALRLIALTCLAMGLLFGAWAPKAGTVREDGALIAGPAWEGWVKPPMHSGKPTLYLADLSDAFSAPKGSEVLVRLYGDDKKITLRETVAEQPEQSQNDQTAYDFVIERSGEIEISGSTGRVWSVALARDIAPTVEFVDELTRAAGGDVRQAYKLSDDLGVERATLIIARDLGAVIPQYGYRVAAEQRSHIELALPVPSFGGRAEIEGLLAENFSEHAFAALPVTVTLQAWDGAGQESALAVQSGVLPRRQFFDPLAAALIDVRAELIWSRANARRSGQVLRAISYAPDGLFAQSLPLLARIKALSLKVENEGEALPDDAIEQVLQSLWDIAVELEDGDLAEALARLRRAQARLDQAMKDGAAPEDIERLMQELREASEAYLRQLAEQQGETNTDQSQGSGGSSQEITTDQIQELMDRIQELMEQGRMSEARRLMDMLNELLENLQVQQGQGQGSGSGQSSQGGGESDPELDELQDALREQQDLSDETFSQLQEQFGESSTAPSPGTQTGQSETSQGRSGADDLRERQQALREELQGGGGDDEDPLAQADQFMRDAEGALSDGDLARALDDQARALQALRDGVRNLADPQSEARDAQAGEGGSESGAGGGESGANDPLGRAQGEATTGAPTQDIDTAHDRARELSEDVQRRAAEQDREEAERDFLNRLLKRF